MDNTNYGELPFEKIVNQNSENVRRKYEEAYQRSSNVPKQKYERKKKTKNKYQLNRAIVIIALVSTMAVSTGITQQITAKHIENNNVVISTSIADNNIDEKIEQYEKLMNMYSDEGNKIEIQTGRNNDEPTVYYNTDNLAKHLVEAAKTSESETRCAIIAAYNIINAPYRNETISEALTKASTNQEENSNYEIPSTAKKFLEELGYENWEEYNSNERDNIKNLKAAEDYVGGKNR